VAGVVMLNEPAGFRVYADVNTLPLVVVLPWLLL
jgi:hypothetical protein